MTFRISVPLHLHERPYSVIRRHWIVPAIRAFLWIVILMAVLVIESWIKSAFPGVEQTTAGEIIALVRTALLMLMVLGLLIVWTMYYLNVQVVTNERIIDINQRSLLHHETTELNLLNVQDVTTEINGIIANIMGYGDVQVQTAGEQQNFIFEQIENPHRVSRTILVLHKKLREQYDKEVVSEANQKNHS